MKTIRHQGRNVCVRWYWRKVVRCEPPKKSPAKRGQAYQDKKAIWVTVLLPTIIHDPHDIPEKRTINIRHWTEQDWLNWLTENYALLQTEIPTIFPSHP